MNPRIQHHIEAGRRANQRDFDRKYGTNKRHPYGIVDFKARQQSRQLLIEVVTLAGLLCLATAAYILAASL